MELLEKSLPSSNVCLENLLNFFHNENFKYGLIHFACHCFYSLEESTNKTCLSLTAPEKTLDIPLQKLLAWAEEYHFKHHPFVFLNACESATPAKLLETTTFPKEMLDFGAGGVIATACTIPDHFASAFASKFYEFLFTKLANHIPTNIGEVLLETRRYFLEKYNNPLGLAYGLYALSNQQLKLID